MTRFKNLLSIFFFITPFVCFGADGAKVNHVEQIAEYVSPHNAPDTPRNYVYMPDGLSYLTLSESGKSIVRHDTKTGEEIETLLDVSKCRGSKIDDITGFTVSKDGSKLLVYNDKKMIYRHSFTARYYVYEIKRNMLTELSSNHKAQRSPLMSPDSRMVAFVADNNIYIKKLDYNTEVAVTTDGKYNEIINGVPDWTYEEEFSTDVSMQWSPDNSTLCFVKYDESQVKTYTFPLYQGTCDAKNEYAYYPGEFCYKYPVAGELNSKVSVHSYDVETRKIKNIKFEDDNIEYIPRIAFGGSSERLIVSTLNRTQNRLELYAVNPKSTVVKSLYVEDSRSWISPMTYETIRFYDDYFVINSERSGYAHLYQYSYNGVQMRQITSGDFEVTGFYGMDQSGNAYIQSTATGELNRVVSKVDKRGVVTHLSPESGYSSAVFAPSFDCFMLSYSNAENAPVYKMITSKGKELRVVIDNADYMAKYKTLSSKDFFTIENDGVKLNAYIIKPRGFSANEKYPVIMTQYSGPGSQEVLNKWKMDWEYYFAEQGYIVACVDGRGTGGRGKDFESVVYKKLGYYETRDQIAAAKYMSQLPYVDESRIGIFGWSYGGYETLMAISHEASPYAAAVAVAPVTDWRYYDTVYAERYMMTPKENEEGYNGSAPMSYTENVKCRLLLMSGTADDNVHFQNTLEYVSKLQMQGTLCDMLVFPNMNHSINHCNARAVVYAKMLDYFNRNM